MDVTLDAFWDGQLTIAQPKDGYRAGIDPVLLAAACPVRSGETVLDLGCGVGTAGLCVARRVQDITLYGVDIVQAYVPLAQENASGNAVTAHFVVGDICARPTPFSDMSFDHVITNPPYFVDGQGTSALDAGRAAGRSAGQNMHNWIETAAKRLRPKGHLTLIQRMERLPDVLSAVDTYFGGIEVLPICARTGRASNLFLLRARKGAKAPFKMHVPLILHQGLRHEKDGDSYTPEVSAVLRKGAALVWEA